MQTILIANRKGGCGKTTLTAHLAVQADASGDGPVTLCDLDPQQSLKRWWEQRETPTPGLSEIPLSSFAAEVERARQLPGILFVDTPGFDAPELMRLIAAADFVVIPVQPSPLDFKAARATVALVKQSGKAFCFVVARGFGNTRLTLQAPLELSQAGPVATTIFYNRVDYAGAMGDGRTVQEIDPKGKAALEMSQLWSYIRQQLGTKENTRVEETAHARA
jgi:chromosome partitioning protein